MRKKAIHNQDADGFDLAAGEYKFTGVMNHEGTHGMAFGCPCGCGDVSAIRFDTSPIEGDPRWHWNGNRESPTLTPSLHKTQGCGWHGYLTNGEFVSV